MISSSTFVTVFEKRVRVKTALGYRANGSAKANYGSSGAEGSPADAERSGAQEAPASQSLFGALNSQWR